MSDSTDSKPRKHVSSNIIAITVAVIFIVGILAYAALTGSH